MIIVLQSRWKGPIKKNGVNRKLDMVMAYTTSVSQGPIKHIGYVHGRTTWAYSLCIVFTIVTTIGLDLHINAERL